MQSLRALFDRTDVRLTRWMARHGVRVLRISLGVVFFWFGVLKFFPDLSPAQELAEKTFQILTFGMFSPDVGLWILATWECVIGLGLILGYCMRAILLLLLVQMFGTMTPAFLFPDEVFTRFPYAPTMEGQYIIKNFVIVSAALVIGATVRGGAVVADPRIAHAEEKPSDLASKDPTR
jgi:uncharacterized membrane protein YphA (DoxX/SURF4 family)